MNLTATIDEIMGQFNFDRVQRCMAHVDWGYHGNPAPPSIAELKDAARHCLEMVCSDKYISSGTGGFVARRSHNSVEGTRLSLAFELVEVDEYVYDIPDDGKEGNQ